MLLGSCSYMLRPILAVLRREAIPFHNPYRKSNGFWNPLRTSSRKSTANRVRALLTRPCRLRSRPPSVEGWRTLTICRANGPTRLDDGLPEPKAGNHRGTAAGEGDDSTKNSRRHFPARRPYGHPGGTAGTVRRSPSCTRGGTHSTRVSQKN